MTYLQAYRTIAKLSFPLFLGQLGNIAVGFADNIMVGHYSTEALASASFVNNFFNVAIFACVGFCYGLTPLVGAMYARGEDKRIGRAVRLGLRINTIFTLIIMGLMTVVYMNIHRMGQPEQLLGLIRPYYLIVLAGMIPITVYNVFAQWSCGLNRTGLPTWIVLAGNALNIAGNYALIYGHWGAPELGLQGAGYSTLAARIFCMVAMGAAFFYTVRGARYRNGFFRGGGNDRGLGRMVAATGFPVAMQMFFETASFSGSAIMAGWLGKIPLAAYQIVVISGMFGFCIYYSIGNAMAIPVSQAAGKGDTLLQRRYAWAGYHLTLLAMVLASCIFLFAGRAVMSLFSDDAAVVAAAVAVIVPMVLYQFGDATQITFANALRGTAKVMPMLYIAFVSYIIVGLPFTYCLGFTAGMGLYGIVLSFSGCLLLAAALYFIFFLRATRTQPNT